MKTTPEFTLPQERPGPTKLLSLYDDFSEFDAYCAFFCDAVGALNERQDDFLDRTTAQGIRLFGGWLKDRSSDLKGELKTAWQEATGANSNVSAQ